MKTHSLYLHSRHASCQSKMLSARTDLSHANEFVVSVDTMHENNQEENSPNQDENHVHQFLSAQHEKDIHLPCADLNQLIFFHLLNRISYGFPKPHLHQFPQVAPKAYKSHHLSLLLVQMQK